MDSPIVRRKLEADERTKKMTDKGSYLFITHTYSPAHSLTLSKYLIGGNTFSAIEQENSRFIDEQQHTTHNILLQQDLELTSLGTHSLLINYFNFLIHLFAPFLH